MKIKYIFALIFLLLSINCFLQTPVFCSSSYYARILNNNVYFYSDPVDNQNYYMFLLPNTYFVEILSSANDENNTFYTARYMGINGYVRKSDVCVVQGTPTMPYANSYSFRMFIPNGVELRRSPTSTNPFNIICTIPFLDTNLIYIGYISGEEQIAQKGQTWIYCKYMNGTDVFYGYIYSAFCDLLPTIPNNNEIFQDFDGDPFEEKTKETGTNNNVFLIDSNLKYIVIVAVCVPGLFLIYLLFKPTKLCVDNGKAKNKIHRLKKSEFYEFDD